MISLLLGMAGPPGGIIYIAACKESTVQTAMKHPYWRQRRGLGLAHIRAISISFMGLKPPGPPEILDLEE
jgi:hypothetical protein